MSLHLTGQLDPPSHPHNLSTDTNPPLSPLLPRSSIIRNPEDLVTREEADFSVHVMVLLADYLDARYELGLIPDRGNTADAARAKAMQAISALLGEINRPYFERRAAASTIAAAGGTAPPPLQMRQRDIDQTLRRVLLYALSVVNSAPGGSGVLA